MSFEKVDLLKMKRERILKSLNWAINAYYKKELSDEEFNALLKILDDDFTKVREELNQYTE